MTDESEPRVVLGVCGGIAAYKAVEVCRRLVDAGVHVAPGAHRRRAALRRRRSRSRRSRRSRARTDAVRRARSDPAHAARPAGRSRGRRAGDRQADRQVRGRASPTTSSPRRSSRRARRCSSCPAMHTEMWEHPAVQENLATLRRRGRARARSRSRPPRGRRRRRRPPRRPGTHRRARRSTLLEPRQRARWRWPASVVVTAGGTREPIDPVRFVGNRSSGKMGHAIAQQAAPPGCAGHARHHGRPAGIAARGRGRAGRDRGADAPTPCSRSRRAPTSS